MESEKKKENCGMIETPELVLPDRICNTSCRTCQSSHLKEIHSLKESGLRLREIAKVIDEKYGHKLSASSLCRHFQNYKKIRDHATAEIIQDNLMPEAVKRAAHTSSVIKLIDGYLELLGEQFKAGIIKANVSDLQKLMDIRYKILDSNDEADANLNIVFENFMNKYGGGDQPLLSSANEPLNFENSQERKEAELVSQSSNPPVAL